MVTLNDKYQYIGRSNAVSCPSGWNYYTLVYAKTSMDISAEKQKVSIKMCIACDVDSTFYGWRTSAKAVAGGETAFSWNNEQIPNTKWANSTLTEGGYTYKRWIEIGEGSAAVLQIGDEGREITIFTEWVMNDEDFNKDWLPDTGRYATASIKVMLPSLERASAITTPTTDVFDYGGVCNISWKYRYYLYYHKLRFRSGDWSYDTEIIKNTSTLNTITSYECPIPMELAVNAPNGTGSIEVTLYTYADKDATNLIGTDTKTYTLRVPETEETKPTVSLMFEPVSNLSAPFDSLYIQGRSKVKVTLDISTKYEASVVESNITVDGVVYDDPYESGYLAKTGPLIAKGSVKDSRGFYGYGEGEITIIPYSKPKVQTVPGQNNVVAARCDGDGNLSSDGTYLKIKAKIGYEKVISDGVQNNFGKLQYRYRAVGDVPYTEWQTILDTETSETDWIVTEPLLNGYLSIKAGYQVQIRAKDYLDESEPITIYVASDAVYMDRPAGGRGMGLGGYSTGNGKLDVYWKTMARGGLSLFTEDGEEISADDTLPLPRSELADGWSPNAIANGVHVVENSAYPLKDAMGNTLMENGVLIQMAATVDGSVIIQIALPTDSYTPVYRIRWYGLWTDWNTFKI